jgi:glutamyl-Q tRNA(Asp) synthetase
MEDIDPPREMAGAADDILHTLERFHLYWDGDVMYQSRRSSVYTEILQAIREKGLAYPCSCTRRELRERGAGTVYDGQCRNRPAPNRTQHSIRVRATDAIIKFVDLVQGSKSYAITQHAGDFIIHRADGQFAYQLAVVIDDAAQKITEVVRGADLVDSTPQQVFLQQLLGYSTPVYGHIPVAVNAAGEKLSKQTGARPVSDQPVVPVLLKALEDLGQSPPEMLQAATIDEVLNWSRLNWQIDRVPDRLAPG